MRKLFTGYKNSVFLPPQILLQHLEYHLRYQINATTAAAVIQEWFISLIVMYVCI